MKRKQLQSPIDPPDVQNDSDPQVTPIVPPIEIEPVAIGDDVYDPRSDSERFPMPEDMPPVATPDESRNS